MAIQDLTETWNSTKEKVQESVRANFPLEGKTRTLVLHGLTVDEKEAPHNDLRSQEEAKALGKIWGAPIYGDIGLVDKITGKEINRAKIKLLTLPKPTSRYSYIVDGKEWQVDQLWRLRSGVFAHLKQNKDMLAEFNLAKPFARESKLYIPFDPAKKQFKLRYGNSLHTSLYSVMKMMGVQDEDMKKAWGEDIYKANVSTKSEQDIKTFYDNLSKRGVKAAGTDYDSVASALVKEFHKAELLPDVTKAILGKPFTHVSGEALLLASQRILGVARGEIKPDDRDSLIYKRLHGVDDFLSEKFLKPQVKSLIKIKVGHNIDRLDKVRDVMAGDLFNNYVRQFFTKSMLSNSVKQVNPLEMLSNSRSTTTMGADEGGIKDEQRLTPSMKLINPSHFGFLDPIHGPEGPRTGITLHLPVGVKKEGTEVKAPVYDLKEKKLAWLTPAELHSEHVLLPDQVKSVDGKWTWENGSPVPISDHVKMMDPKTHEITPKPFKEARYLLASSHQLFDEATNLIPFLQNNQGNRTMTASRQATQAVGLEKRELPLVQVQSGGDKSWEKIIGTPWSHTSTVDGKVVEIKKNAQNGYTDALIIKDTGGTKHEVQLYNHFPLNDSKSFMHSTPVVVVVGDTVKKGQVLADSNFTKDGGLALGTNLRVGYIPYKGYNFEDGIVISKSAAEKLTSEHLHRHTVEIDPSKDFMSKEKFRSYASTTASRMTKDQSEKLDQDGVIRVGSRVQKGDILIAAVGKREITAEVAQIANRLGRHMFDYQNKSATWDAPYQGEVVKVTRAPNGKGATVFVRTLEQAEVGDKIVGRHGNKGIITRILPNEEMPRVGGPDGEHIEIAMNPSGIASRINLGQMLETASGKIAKKTGQPYMVNNFGGVGIDYTQKVKDDLKTHGLSDSDILFDPTTRKPLGDVLTGYQYIYKLEHQAEKGLSTRSYGPNYSLDYVPKGSGSDHPGQVMDQLGLYALLAHGARANLREMSTYKAGKILDEKLGATDFWDRVMMGLPLPAPKPTFAYKKFEALLTGLGINIRKDGHVLQLTPLTDKGVLSMSNGEIKDPGRVLRGKDAKELERGLFDPKITGGLSNAPGKGMQWSHIALAEPMPNPIFVGTSDRPGPIVLLTGLKFNEVEDIAKGKKYVDGKTGGTALSDMLKKIDVKSELKKTVEQLSKLNGPALNKANRKAKYLLALDKLNMKPQEAYISNYIPVLPPVFRPIVPMPDGSLRFDDINHIYHSIGLVNDKLKNPIKELPDEENQQLREQLYDLTKTMAGTGGKPVYESNRKMKGILDVIGGDQPKLGYFQNKLMKRRQELSMHSTIVPDPKMGLDYVGIPRNAAMELYKPFVVTELQKYAYNPVEAFKEIKDGSPVAWTALQKAIEKRPILLKRDPALHKFSIMAFKPHLVDGQAIQIHPLVCAGYNADFDGDKMSAFVPLTDDAVREAHKMLPSNNLFSSTNGGIMYAPDQESLLGLHLLSKWGKETGKSFSTYHEAMKAKDVGSLRVDDVIHVAGKQTTLGRLILADSLPENSKTPEFAKLLQDPEFSLVKHTQSEKKIGVHDLLDSIAKHDPHNFPTTVDRLKDLGNNQAYDSGFSFRLKDLEVDKKSRDHIIKRYDEQAAHVHRSSLSQADKDEKLIDIYGQATKDLKTHFEPHFERSDNHIYKMVSTGARGKWSQFMQMNIAPMLMKDGTGKTLPNPVKRSYTEGLDIGDYWTTLHGARMGTLQRVEGTADPGVLTKNIVNVMAPNMIASHDCGTTDGIHLDVNDLDVHGRHLAAPVNIGGKPVAIAGDLVTPQLTSLLKKNKVDKVVVRSPLKCAHGQGICAKCFGLNENGLHHEIGVNIGVIAGQSLGEPATQLAMDSFHCNHADSLVFVRPVGGDFLVLSMESLFNIIESPTEFVGSEEIKTIKDWEIYDGRWVQLTHVRRHAPEKPMVLVGDGGFATICQDNHPVGVWENLVSCTKCGYHRLKAPSPASRGKKSYCPECGLHQEKPETEIGRGGFLQPIEMTPGKYFLHRDITPVLEAAVEKEITPPEFPGYFVGMFLSEGCVLFRHAYKHVGMKKPYTVTITQNDGEIKDRIVQNLPDGYRATVNAKAVVIQSLELGTRLTELFGRYSHGKALPPQFIGYPKEWLATMLCGVIDGDGSIKRVDDGPDQIVIDTTSFEMAQQFVLICARLGISAGIVASTVVELTRHQGYRVALRMTAAAVAQLHASLKVSQVKKLSPDQEPVVVGYKLLRTIKSILYTKAFVYDATTETGSLYVSGLKSHNTGGVAASRGGGSFNKFTRLKQLLNIPKTLPDAARLANISGRVTKVEKDEATNGWNIYVGDEKHYTPAQVRPIVRPGEEVQKGRPLTEGPIDPRALLKLTDIHNVQNYLTSELFNAIYKDERVKRRNIETVIRSMTNLARVTDPGDSDHFSGDIVQRTMIEEHNRNLSHGKMPVKAESFISGAEQTALDQHEDWMARLNFQRLGQTILEGTAKGWTTNLHSPNPLPSYAHGAEFGKGTKANPHHY